MGRLYTLFLCFSTLYFNNSSNFEAIEVNLVLKFRSNISQHNCKKKFEFAAFLLFFMIFQKICVKSPLTGATLPINLLLTGYWWVRRQNLRMFVLRHTIEKKLVKYQLQPCETELNILSVCGYKKKQKNHIAASFSCSVTGWSEVGAAIFFFFSSFYLLRSKSYFGLNFCLAIYLLG